MTAYKTRDLAWIVGTGLMLANMPFTLLFILPTNKRLMATEEKGANASTRADLEHWGKLHAVRTGLGIAATFAFLYGLIRTG